MTLTVARTIGVLDRTGHVLAAARSLQVESVEVPLTAFALVAGPDVDVLVVGARELSATGLRRLGRWTRAHPASVVVAYVDGLDVDRAELRAAGVEHLVRGRLTAPKLATALRRAEKTLELLCAATERFHGGADGTFSFPGDAVPSAVEGPVALEPWPAEPDQAQQHSWPPVPQPRPSTWAEELEPDDGYGDEEPEDEPSISRARLVTIASATGGCGKTFYATNAAALLARHGARVLLVDLDLQFGEVAAALQVKHPYSIYDGLYTATGDRLPRSAFSEHLDELVHHHPLGFDVLTAPRDPVLADYVGARDAATVLDAVADRYDVVLADTPPSLNDVVIAALDRSVSVIVLATLDVPSLRNLTAFMDVLRRLGLDDDRVELVLNKAERDVGVTVEQANQAFDNRFRSVLPVDRAVSRSVNLGTSVVTHEPKAKVSRALVPAVDRLADRLDLSTHPLTTDVTQAEAGRFRSVLDRLVRRLAFGGQA